MPYSGNNRQIQQKGEFFMNGKISDNISQNIKKYRLLNNMTQEELSNLLELDTQYYSQLERGERNFTIEKIIRLCQVLHVGIENIIPVENILVPDTSAQIAQINQQIRTLSPSQLVILEKFIAEVLIYIK